MIHTPSGLIDMSQTGIPLLAEDETGYRKFLPPYSGTHQFPGAHIQETRRKGGKTTSFNPTIQYPMKKMRGYQRGGKAFDSQLGNYRSGVSYMHGGWTVPDGYPYEGYNDSMRGMFSGLPMQAGGNFKLKLKGSGALPFFQQAQPYAFPGFGGTSAFMDIHDGSMYNDNLQQTDAFGNRTMASGGKHWIQGAINPAHKGFCTPMTKSTCTGRRRALALLFKRKHGFHKKEDGGMLQEGLVMQAGGYPANYVPAPPQFSFGNVGRSPNAGDSAVYQNDYNFMKRGAPAAAYGDYSYLQDNVIPALSMSNRPGADSLLGHAYSTLGAYNDALQPGTMMLNLPPDTRRPRKQAGGSFAPAGSMVNPMVWANDPSQVAAQTDYRKSETPHFSITSHQPSPWLEPLMMANTALAGFASANERRQQQQYVNQNLNNPLSNLPWDNGRPQETLYGYNPYRKGGSFQQGGSLMDQWDVEDAQDGQDQAQSQDQYSLSERAYTPADFQQEGAHYNNDDLSNTEEYDMALQQALYSQGITESLYTPRFNSYDFDQE